MVLYFQLSQANRKKDYITSMLCLTQLPQSKCLWLLNWHSHMVTPPTARQKVRDISIEAQLLSSITLIPGGSWGTGWVNNLMELEYQHPAACVLDRGAECNSGQGKRKVITVGRGLIPSYFSTRMSSSSFSSAFAAVQVAKRPKKCVLYSRASFHWWNENKIKILLKLATAADIKKRYWCLKKKLEKALQDLPYFQKRNEEINVFQRPSEGFPSIYFVGGTLEQTTESPCPWWDTTHISNRI